MPAGFIGKAREIDRFRLGMIPAQNFFHRFIFSLAQRRGTRIPGGIERPQSIHDADLARSRGQNVFSAFARARANYLGLMAIAPIVLVSAQEKNRMS